MRTKPIILLFLATSLLLASDYSFLMVSGVSPGNVPMDPTTTQGLVPSIVGATQNSNNIIVTGNLKISGNNIVNFVGQPSLHANVYINGSIDIVGNGTLVLKYATLYFVGAKNPYDRYIRLSNSTNGHPKLIVMNSTIDAYPTSIIVNDEPTLISYGVAVYAYNNSEISAILFNVYRESVDENNYNLGGQTVIKAYGGASVNLTSVTVDSVLTYDQAHVSIYSGTGPKRITLMASPPDVGIYFESHNTSIVRLYGVTFKNVTAVDEAHLLLTHCIELLGGEITTSGRSRVDCLAGTSLVNSQLIPRPPAFTVKFIPAISASGYSYVSLSSSQISSSDNTYPTVSLYDHATFAVLRNVIIDSGQILAFDHSTVVLNNTQDISDLINDNVVGYDSSIISIFNSTLSALPFVTKLSLFGGSHLSVVNSVIAGGWLQFFDNATVYVSHSQLRGSFVPQGYGLRIACQGNANVTVVASGVTAHSFEVSDNARLVINSSNARVIYCLDSSRVSLAGDAVDELRVSDSASMEVMNSTVGELSLAYSNVTGSLTGLTSFFKNSTLALPGSSLDVSILNTTINGLSFAFSGDSNVTISNSTIRNLSMQDSSSALLNITSVGGSVYVVGNSKVLEYSPLRVRCVDYFGNPLNGSIVSIETGSIEHPIVLERQTADKSGLVDFILFWEMSNATGAFPFGEVTVSGSFRGALASVDISISSMNRDVTLSFSLPSWSVYIFPLVVFLVIVALLTLTYYILKRVRGKRE
jgi:hypothetical protein